MSENNTDRRSLMSRRMLKEALTELMKTKSINEISIKKVCEKADVNRSTFYRYYTSPYELYDEILEDVGRDIAAIAAGTEATPHRLKAMLTEIFTYIEQNRELVLVLLSENGDLKVGEKMTGLIAPFLGDSSELTAYCTQFITAGLSNIIWTWLNKEDRRSPREMAAMVNALLVHGVRRALASSSSSAPNRRR